MGSIREGVGKFEVEERRESFIVHYNPATGGDFERHWRENPHPEFVYDDLVDLITALTEMKGDYNGRFRAWMKGRPAKQGDAPPPPAPRSFLVTCVRCRRVSEIDALPEGVKPGEEFPRLCPTSGCMTPDSKFATGPEPTLHRTTRIGRLPP